jgi:hypothetical protein
MSFNPNLKDFLDEQPEEKSLIGFAWSLYWRLAITIMLFYIVIMFGLFVLSAMIAGMNAM